MVAYHTDGGPRKCAMKLQRSLATLLQWSAQHIGTRQPVKIHDLPGRRSDTETD